MNRALLLALVAATLLAGCVSVRWDRTLRFEVIADEHIDALVEGEDDLQTCLDRFGAPLFVYEQPANGFAVSYGWFRSRTLGGRVSYPLTRLWSPSFDYSDVTANLYGVVLFFDADEQLVRSRRGYLRNIEPERRQPTPVEQLEEDEPSSDTEDE